MDEASAQASFHHVSRTRNQDDEIVLSMVAKVLFQRQDSS